MVYWQTHLSIVFERATVFSDCSKEAYSLISFSFKFLCRSRVYDLKVQFQLSEMKVYDLYVSL